MFPCVDCEFLFDKLPVTLCEYTVSLRDTFVSCIFALNSSRTPKYSACESLGEFVCPKRERESTSRCSLRPLHPAINHTALLIVLKSCHARVTLLFHAEESRTSSTWLSLRVAIKIGSTICQSCIALGNASRRSISFLYRVCFRLRVQYNRFSLSKYF